MTYEAVKEYLGAKPFVPFTVHMNDGRGVTIDTPKYTSWTMDRSRFVFNDHGAHLVYMQLDSINQLAPAELEESVQS